MTDGLTMSPIELSWTAKNVQNSGVIGHGDDNNEDDDDLIIC